MEVEDLHQTQPPCKFSRIGNGGRSDNSKIGTTNGVLGGGDHHHHLRQFQADTEEDGGEIKMSLCNTPIGTGPIVASAADGVEGPNSTTGNRLRGWHHSRIIRVSRASGGKDRHSKVWTSKGLRDRRVRLSVTTAIQFYDLQDRLGYDQPSKAVEWLIKAAADAISELPSLNASFPDIPKQYGGDEKRSTNTTTGGGGEQGFDSADLELEEGEHNNNQSHLQQQLSLSKSACSCNSETSKGSGLSLSRSDVRVSRVKARDRAREKAAAKEKDKDPNVHHRNHLSNTMSQNSTFTELLTGGIGNTTTTAPPTTTSSPSGNSEVNLFHKTAATAKTWPSTAMDYFGPGLLGPPSSSRHSQHQHHSPSGFLGQIQMPQGIPQFNLSTGGENTHNHNHNHNHHHQQHHHHQEQQQLQLQHFPFVSDYLMPVAATSTQGGQQHHQGVDYNLNFTISSSGLAGFNRGTLQSNSSPSPSPSLVLPQQLQQRFPSHIDGSSATHLPFFIGGGAAGAPPPLENHNHLFPSGLQLCYGDGSSSRHSDQKGKGGN